MIEIIEEQENVITLDNIGEKLRRMRIGKGWSCAEMAKQSLLAPSTIAKTEEGRLPNLYTIMCMADVFGYELIMREKR